MQFYVLHNELILPVKGGDPFARVEWSNPLEATPSSAPPPAGPSRVVQFSGWFDEEAAALPREGIFPSDFRTWTPSAWEALDALCDRSRPHLEDRGQTICFRPHARHILADPQACLSFLRRREGQPFEVLLDAAAFLTPEMLGRVEDHLRRAYEALVHHEQVVGLLLANAKPADDGLAAAPLTAGCIEPALLARLALQFAAHLPIILLAQDQEAQLAFLEQQAGA